MTIKQTAARPAQLTIILIISAIFCYILITLFGFYGAMSAQRSAAKIFGLPLGDIQFSIFNDENGEPFYAREEILDEIKKQADIKMTWEGIDTFAEIDGNSIRTMSYSTFEGIDLSDPISGRYPKYDNEVMITPQIETLLKVKLGDKILMKGIADTVDFIVCGIASRSFDMGRVFVVTTQGVKRLGFYNETTVVILEQSDKMDEIIESLNNKYGESVLFYNYRDQISSITSSIRIGVLSVTVLIIIIAILLIMLVTLLISQIAIIREKSDMAVLKSAGYSSAMLRRQFSRRFFLSSFIGCIIGLLIALAFSDKMMGTVLGLAGMSSFAGDKSWWVLCIPILLLSLFTTLFAYISAGRIKRISLRELIAE